MKHNHISITNNLDVTTNNESKLNQTTQYLTMKDNYKHKQNRSNTKSMFFTEDMEYVNNLKLTDPNYNYHSNYIQPSETLSNNFEISTHLLKIFTKSIQYTPY